MEILLYVDNFLFIILNLNNDYLDNFLLTMLVFHVVKDLEISRNRILDRSSYYNWIIYLKPLKRRI